MQLMISLLCKGKSGMKHEFLFALGMPHNQLGTLKQQAGYSDFEIAYHYFRW